MIKKISGMIRGKINRHNIIFLAVAAMVVGSVFFYVYSLQLQIRNYAYHAVEQNSQSIANEVDTYVVSAYNSIQVVSNMITEALEDSDLTRPELVTSGLVDQSPFDFIEFIDKDGMNMTAEGENFDASDRVYYQEGIQGKTGIWINYSPKYSEEYLLDFYTPVYRGEKIIGVITGGIGADTNLLPIIRSDFFEQEVISIICESDGKIISSTVDVGEEVAVENVLSSLGVYKESDSKFKERFRKGNSKVFELNGLGGSLITSITEVPNQNWRMLQIIPPESVKTIRKQNAKGAYHMILLIIVILLAYFCYWHLESRRRHREVLQKKDEEVQNYGVILLATASDTYKGIRRLDLETGKAEYIYFDNHVVKKTDMGDWMEWLRRQEQYVHPEDFGRMCAMINIDRLRAMKEGVSDRFNYRSVVVNEEGYNNTYSTTVSILEEKGRKIAVLTTIDTTESILTEMWQKKMLASAASIYISMHAINLKSDTFETLSCEKHISKIVGKRNDNVRHVLRDTMLELTDEKFREAVLEFIDLDTLDERMKGSNTITMEFLGVVSGWCRARFVAVEYDEEHRLRNILWVIENIDAEKKKANQLLYLSETDLMTGIRNRGSGERKIKEMLMEGHQGMFCLLDADKFKSVNDNYGHGVGDKVIIAIANCLTESFREADVVLRLGGDEFAVFADGITTPLLADRVIKRFFKAIDNIKVPELGERKISVSLGAAFRKHGDGMTFEVLYHNADECTYESKKVSGNSYTIYKGESV